MKRTWQILSILACIGTIALMGAYHPAPEPKAAPRALVMNLASFNKFNQFVEDVGRKVHNLNADTLKIGLTNSAPSATNTVYANITEIAAGNGYTAGGTAVGSTAYSQSSGTAKLTGNAVTFTASGGAMATFRYAVLYNDTPTSPADPLIGWWDYASSVTLNTGESLTIGKDTSGGNWDSSTPILSITRLEFDSVKQRDFLARQPRRLMPLIGSWESRPQESFHPAYTASGF